MAESITDQARSWEGRADSYRSPCSRPLESVHGAEKLVLGAGSHWNMLPARINNAGLNW